MGNCPGDQTSGTTYTVFKVRVKNSDIQKGKSAGCTENGQLTLDEPLTLAHNSRVRVIVLVSEEEDLDDTPIAEIREGIYRGWPDALAGRIKPVSQLWDGLDVD